VRPASPSTCRITRPRQSAQSYRAPLLLFVEPAVFEAPAVVNTVHHDGQPFHPRLPAGGAHRVEDDGPNCLNRAHTRGQSPTREQTHGPASPPLPWPDAGG